MILALGCGVLSAAAQQYDQTEMRNVWNRSDNVTGLLRDSIVVSNAELYFNSEQGEFRNFSEGASRWSAGAQAKNLAHRDNLSMIGAFSYSHTSISDASGSMFIQPTPYPVDVLEFTPGEKALQRYHFMGGLSTEILPRFSIGLKGEFTSQNYAKFKDLRHYNYRMDFAIAPAVSYRLGDLTLGANYKYTKNSEAIRAKEIGTTAEPYSAFLNKGLMFGAYQQWEGGGVHLSTAGIGGFPVAQNGHSVAMQLDYKGVYAEVVYNYSAGTIGEKQTFWFDFPSESIAATLGYTLVGDQNIHIFLLEAEVESMLNFENVVNEETSNGITTTIIYGNNQIFSSKRLSIEPKYRLLFGNGGFLKAGAGYYSIENQATQMYPCVDELSLHYIKASASGMAPIGNFELRGGLLFSTGAWSDNSYTVKNSVEVGDKPYHFEEYYNIENEFLTATHLDASLSLRYNIARGFYSELGGQYIKAFDVKYVGDSLWGVAFKVGYNF